MAVDTSIAAPRGRRTTRRAPGWAMLAGMAVLAAFALGGVSSATADAVVPPPIPVGNGPVAVAFSPDGTKAYVTNYNDDSVTVIDVATNIPASTTIPVGDSPVAVAFSPANGTKAYVANFDGNSVTVIDVAANTASTTIPVGGTPTAVAFSPDGTKAYVTNSLDDSVTVIDVATNTPASTVITVGNAPNAVAFSPDGAKAYVANFGNDAVTVIDVANSTATSPTIPVGNSPWAVAFSPDGIKAYVTNNSDDSVTVISADVAPRITSASPTAGAAGTPYSFTVTAIANPAATFTVTVGALPPGLGLDAATGVISGTPTSSGSFSFTITATNTFGPNAQSHTDAEAYTMIVALAATGVGDPMPFILIASVLLLAGIVALSVRGLVRRRGRP